MGFFRLFHPHFVVLSTEALRILLGLLPRLSCRRCGGCFCLLPPAPGTSPLPPRRSAGELQASAE